MNLMDYILRTGIVLLIGCLMIVISLILYIKGFRNKKENSIWVFSIILFIVGSIISYVGYQSIKLSNHDFIGEKPVVYLYGYDGDVDVKLNLSDDITLTHTYPKYNSGWKVIASPDGTLRDYNGRKYDYLFWEGDVSLDFNWNMSSGFCVKGEDTARFLEMMLSRLGLNESESDDFITYWLPRMEDNPYNIISFQGRNYTDAVDIVPSKEPDTEIRVYMVWYGTPVPVNDLPVQKIKDNSGFERYGKTIVEWGGTELYES